MDLHQKVLRKTAGVMMAIGVVAALLAGLGLEIKTVHGSGSCSGGPNPGCGGGLVCPLVFEAVLGSGERWAGDTNLTSKVSPALYRVYQNIAFPPNFVNADGSSKPEVSVVQYPALSVTTLLHGPDMINNVDTYLGSERDGVAELWTAIGKARSKCSSTQFILAGYSQGAMVVHDFLNQLAATGYTLQTSIVGAVLVADPDRVKHSAARELSTAPSAAYGICDVVSTLHIGNCPADSPLQDIAPLFRSRTVSVCAYGDAVCDTSDLVNLADLTPGGGAVLAASIAQGIGTHLSYQHLAATGNAGTVMSQLFAATL